MERRRAQGLVTITTFLQVAWVGMYVDITLIPQSQLEDPNSLEPLSNGSNETIN